MMALHAGVSTGRRTTQETAAGNKDQPIATTFHVLSVSRLMGL